MQKTKEKFKERKTDSFGGSVLVYTLIVMFIVLTGALAISAASIFARKTTGTTAKSTQAFLVAESAVEKVMRKISEERNGDIQSFADSLGGGAVCNPATGIITGSIATGRDYSVIFYDNAGTAQLSSCADSIFDIGQIKITGSYEETTRAIEIAVAATAQSAITDCVTETVSHGTVFEINLIDSGGDNICTDSDGCEIRLALLGANRTSSNPLFFYQHQGTNQWSLGRSRGVNGAGGDPYMYDFDGRSGNRLRIYDDGGGSCPSTENSADKITACVTQGTGTYRVIVCD